jgi:acylphosphatase
VPSSGSAESVAAFEAWLREGPPLAEVESVEISEESGRVEGGFRIL